MNAGSLAIRDAEHLREALDLLGSLLDTSGETVSDHATSRDIFAPIPLVETSFMALVEIVEAMLALDDVDDRGGPVRSATTRQLLAEIRPTADSGAVPLPSPGPLDDVWEVALAWITDLLETAL